VTVKRTSEQNVLFIAVGVARFMDQSSGCRSEKVRAIVQGPQLARLATEAKNRLKFRSRCGNVSHKSNTSQSVYTVVIAGRVRGGLYSFIRR